MPHPEDDVTGRLSKASLNQFLQWMLAQD